LESVLTDSAPACPADPALGKTVSIDFTKGSDPNFFLLQGTSLKYGSNGAEFVNSKETDAPTIESEWYIFFGKIEVVAQAATGQGIVSSFVLQSDDLDEVDWVRHKNPPVTLSAFGTNVLTIYTGMARR
jgi:hypothetical protein